MSERRRRGRESHLVERYSRDRDTGAPLGRISTERSGSDRGGQVTETRRQRFLVIRELPPTAANLAELREHSLRP